jgi:hypothetical protein
MTIPKKDNAQAKSIAPKKLPDGAFALLRSDCDK